MAELATAAVDRLIRKAGAERVSEDAAKALGEILEEIGTKIAAKAIKLARHSGRVTVTSEDIRLARE